jgi:hypothetical protein
MAVGVLVCGLEEMVIIRFDSFAAKKKPTLVAWAGSFIESFAECDSGGERHESRVADAGA